METVYRMDSDNECFGDLTEALKITFDDGNNKIRKKSSRSAERNDKNHRRSTNSGINERLRFVYWNKKFTFFTFYLLFSSKSER